MREIQSVLKVALKMHDSELTNRMRKSKKNIFRAELGLKYTVAFECWSCMLYF